VEKDHTATREAVFHFIRFHTGHHNDWKNSCLLKCHHDALNSRNRAKLKRRARCPFACGRDETSCLTNFHARHLRKSLKERMEANHLLG
jgi:hypothetical protein